MDRQAVFEKVARHLLTQNEMSLSSPARCAYRGRDGLKCAIGCLIDDSDYRPEFEGLSVLQLFKHFPSLKQTLDVKTDDEIKFLSILQYFHDNIKPCYWKEALSRFAYENLLTFPHELA